MTTQATEETALAQREAVCYYLGDRDSGRPGWRYPRFRIAAPTTADGELTLTVGDPVQLALAREAERQGVSGARLLQHAVLYYLADLHSGRAARRAIRDLG